MSFPELQPAFAGTLDQPPASGPRGSPGGLTQGEGNMNASRAADAASLNLSGRPGSTLERPPLLSQARHPAAEKRHPGPAHPALIVADAGRLSVATLPLLGAA